MSDELPAACMQAGEEGGVFNYPLGLGFAIAFRLSTLPFAFVFFNCQLSLVLPFRHFTFFVRFI